MTTIERDYDRLFAEELDAIAAEKNYILEAQKLLEAEFVSTPNPPQIRFRKPIWGAIAAGLLLAIGLSLFLSFKNQELTAHVRGSNEAIISGSWISSAKRKELALTFSDGSIVEMDENTEIRVQSLKKKGAHLLLERGIIDVSVVHEGIKDWTFDVGPYRVLVTGTRFNVRWVPEDQKFKLDLKEGSVKVQGPMIEEGKVLKKGNRIRVSLLDRVAEISKISRSDRGEEDGHQSTGIEALEMSPKEVHDRPTFPSRAKRVSWRALAKKGNFDDAASLLRPSDFARLKARGSVADLMLAGDATRLSGRNIMAFEAYRAVRKRYPRTREAERAAFMLGRLYLDRKGDSIRAAKWFDICYRENRQGVMAREAAGRLIEALDRAGEQTRAKQAAQEYMNRFPTGPHKKLAQKILSKTVE